MTRRVLVTGATGFVGRHTIAPLQARGFDVHAVTSRSPLPGTSGVRWHEGDLLRPTDRRAVIDVVRPTHLLHLAWAVEPGAFWTSPENLPWVGASLDLLRTFVEAGGRRAVMAGTCAEYRWQDGDLSEAGTPIEPATLYGTAKDAVHRVSRAYARQQMFELAWARLFFSYGPHEPAARLVPSMAIPLLRGEPARCGSGTAVRDYLHVADVGDALAMLLTSAVSGPVNIGSGAPVTVRAVGDTLGRLCGRPDLVARGSREDRAGDPPRIVADVRRLRDEVGWRPTVSFEQGLSATLEWWRAQLAAGVAIKA